MTQYYLSGGVVRHTGAARVHPLLAFTMGIKELVLAVNKMDIVKWDQVNSYLIVICDVISAQLQ